MSRFFFLHHFLSEIRINWSGKPLKCLSLYSYLHNRCLKAYTKFTKFGLSSFNTLRLSSIKSMLYLKNFSNHLSNCKIFLIWFIKFTVLYQVIQSMRKISSNLNLFKVLRCTIYCIYNLHIPVGKINIKFFTFMCFRYSQESLGLFAQGRFCLLP